MHVVINKSSPIHTTLSVQESWGNSLYRHMCESYRCGEGKQICCSSNPPLEEVSELQQRHAGICVYGKAGDAGKGCVGVMVFTV